jgi:hypothetical protein
VRKLDFETHRTVIVPLIDMMLEILFLEAQKEQLAWEMAQTEE